MGGGGGADVESWLILTYYGLRASAGHFTLSFSVPGYSIKKLLKDPRSIEIVSHFQFVLLILLFLTVVPYAQMAASLSFFLTSAKPRANFGSPYYMLASACALPIAGLHFFWRPPPPAAGSQDQDESSSATLLSSYYTIGCVDNLLAKAGLQPIDRIRPFPVVLIFHVVVTVCYMFMQMQMGQHHKNIQMVIKLRQDLEESEAAKKQK